MGKLRPRQRRKFALHILARIEPLHHVVAFLRAVDMNRILGRLMLNKAVEHAGNLQRNARAHDDVADAAQHGSVNARQMRRLDLLQKVDTHRILVLLPSEIHLNEVGNDAKLHQFARIVLGQNWHPAYRVFGSALSAGDEYPSTRGPPSHDPESIQPAPHVSTGVAVLQTPRQNLVERSSRNEA